MENRERQKEIMQEIGDKNQSLIKEIRENGFTNAQSEQLALLTILADLQLRIELLEA